MTLARTLLIIIVGAFFGVLPLTAQGPGGDGGVVILPIASQITSDPQSLGTANVTSSVSIKGAKAIRLRLPVEMVDAFAVMLLEGGVTVPVRVVAQEIEIDGTIMQALTAAGIERVDILIVSPNSLAIRVSVLLSEGYEATVRIH